MQYTISIILAILFLQVAVKAQNIPKSVPSPVINSFAPTLQFLASPGLEGRETGTRGAAIAADYIASRMENMGLKPFNRTSSSSTQLADYFQPFKLLRCNTEKSSMSISFSRNREPQLKLRIYYDFKTNNVLTSLSIESTPVFAGYGIFVPELGYNDYSGLDVKGKIVIILEGYPGQQDSTSIAWKKFKTVVDNDEFDLDKKCQEAAKQGASAIITINKAFLASNPANLHKKNVAPVKNEDYADAEYLLPSNAKKSLSSCFRLNKNSSEKLATLLGIDFRKTEQHIAQQLTFKPMEIKHVINLNTTISIDTIIVNNVIGLLAGRDTSQTMILGAHYDHLGKRGNVVFYGSDDNASGVAGILALAQMWTESGLVPPYNLIFASWTAEEKGLIGSEYYVSKLTSPEKVKFYINMDMISRSIKEDSTHRQLSIGTRKADEYLRDIAKASNSTLTVPFKLDLWDVTGHSGSDYASFMAINVPVMTYNSGLHDDYHTPRDIPANAELQKMGDVLRVVQECLNKVLEK